MDRWHNIEGIKVKVKIGRKNAIRVIVTTIVAIIMLCWINHNQVAPVTTKTTIVMLKVEETVFGKIKTCIIKVIKPSKLFHRGPQAV